MKLFSIESRIIHNHAGCEATGGQIRITTPAEQWAYAVEFPPAAAATAPEGEIVFKLRVRVHRGAIGLGVLDPQQGRYQHEIQVVADDKTEVVEIPVPNVATLGSLMLRNTSTKGHSTADFEFLGCEKPSLKSSEPEEIVIDPHTFAPFKPWSGFVPGGFFADWTGILTRAGVWAFTDDYLSVYNRDRHEDKAVPIEGAFVLDWTPLAQAVKDASHTFRMAALGAGWGRWLAGGAALAAQTGRDYRLLGVEAEPQHFEWMLRHFRENNIPEDRYIALNAAAAGTPGNCLFAVGNSQAWYGQSIISKDQKLREDTNVRRTRGVTMDELLNLLSPLDYMQLDVQGAELDVLSYRPERIDREIRLINIGTHSAEIEAGLRKLFRQLGWECLYDVKLGSTHAIRLGTRVAPDIEFGDGVQIWRNPRFANG